MRAWLIFAGRPFERRNPRFLRRLLSGPYSVRNPQAMATLNQGCREQFLSLPKSFLRLGSVSG